MGKYKDLKVRMEIKDEQIKNLMEIFGLSGYKDGCIKDSVSSVSLFSYDYIQLNKNKLPTKSEDFNLLLDYLKLEIKDKKIERKVVNKKKKK